MPNENQQNLKLGGSTFFGGILNTWFFALLIEIYKSSSVRFLLWLVIDYIKLYCSCDIKLCIY